MTSQPFEVEPILRSEVPGQIVLLHEGHGPKRPKVTYPERNRQPTRKQVLLFRYDHSGEGA